MLLVLLVYIPFKPCKLSWSLATVLTHLGGVCAQAFVNQVSGYEGAEVPEGLHEDVSFDNPAFWRELKAALGVAADEHGLDLDLDSDTASSSDGFLDDDDDDDSKSAGSSSPNSPKGSPIQADQANAMPSRQEADTPMHAPGLSASLRQQNHTVPPVTTVHAGTMPYNSSGEAEDDSSSDVLTATDSDDEEAGFMHAYDEALAQELSGSRVGSILHPAEGGDHQSTGTEGEEHGGNDVKPVDLDTNLVRSLLQSYTAQQGLAGPAGNLAGLLGLNLPDNADTD